MFVFVFISRVKKHIQKYKTEYFCKCYFAFCVNRQSTDNQHKTGGKSDNFFVKVLYVVFLFIFFKNFIRKT